MLNLYRTLKTTLVISFMLIAFCQQAYSQAVSINATGAAPNAESILDVNSTTKGVLLPRLTSGQRTSFTPTVSGMTVYDVTTESYWYWDDTANAWREIPNTNSISSTLDEAYDGGGSGAGRTITVDASAVQLTGTSGSVALSTDGDIQMAEDQWIGLGSSIERFEFDGSLNRIDVEGADLTMDTDKWIGIDGSSPRIEFEDGSGRLNMQNADIELDEGKWIGLNASNPRILFEGGTTDRITIEDADVRIDNNKWIGLGSSIERFEFQGSDGEVNLMGAEFGIGTLAPTTELDVNGQIRMRTGATAGYIPVGDGNGVMTWTDPATITSADVTLDEAYDGNSPGGGRIITADNGAVDIQGAAGLLVSGNIGIGTTDQTSRLVVNGSNSDAEPILSLRSGNNNTTFNDGAQIAFGYSGTSNYSHFIHTRHDAGSDFNNAIDFFVSDGSTASNSVSTGSVNTMTLTGSGNVGIGVTNPSVKFQVAGDATISGKFNSNGIQESSDRRFKKDISPIQNALEKVLKLEGVTYNWRVEEFPSKNFSNRTEIGVIAQDLEKIYPELVSTDKEGYKSVQYSHLVPVLLEAIKEQQKQIAELQTGACNLSASLIESENRFTSLSNEIDKLKAELLIITPALGNK